tara:strand:+ start:159 stop:653 length:495 start_codon:yes stop_codon:yes gene_type:complete
MILPLVNAGMGRTFDLDFNVKEEYDLWLQKSDRVRFEYGEYNHTIITDEIKNKTVEIDVFLFLERGLHTPHYAYITEDHDLGLDFDKDGAHEMGIGISKIEMDNGKAHFVFAKLEAWDENAQITFEDPKKDISPVLLIIVMMVLVIIFILIMTYFFNRKQGVYF